MLDLKADTPNKPSRSLCFTDKLAKLNEVATMLESVEPISFQVLHQSEEFSHQCCRFFNLKVLAAHIQVASITSVIVLEHWTRFQGRK